MAAISNWAPRKFLLLVDARPWPRYQNSTAAVFFFFLIDQALFSHYRACWEFWISYNYHHFLRTDSAPNQILSVSAFQSHYRPKKSFYRLSFSNSLFSGQRPTAIIPCRCNHLEQCQYRSRPEKWSIEKVLLPNQFSSTFSTRYKF